MVRELEKVSGQKHNNNDFPAHASTAHPVFYRTYSRRTENGRETWTDVCDRTVTGLEKLGKLTKAERDLIYKMQQEIKALTSGRWLWVGGTEWIENPPNFSGAYNCSSTNITDWRSFGLLMDLAMMGCGTGAVLEPRYINQLPTIKNIINVTIAKEIGSVPAGDRQTETIVTINDQQVLMIVGDSRQGWVQSYQTLLEFSTDQRFNGTVDLQVDLSHVRPAGEKLKGFGGVANPVKLTELYVRCSAILNKAIGRQLNSVECCLLIDEAAVTIVAGNIRRCIAYGERVSAISGMKPIQDINVGELVLTSSGEYKPVVNKFIQGVQDIVEIRTAETSIRCTAKHKIAVYNSLESYTWKYAGELQPGDRLISVPHRKGLPCSTADYAWLVGFFIGDGHADIASSKRRNGGGGSVTFAFSRERLNGALGQKCLRILKSLGYTPSISMQENQAYIKVYRKELADELIQYKQPWSTPIIPEFLWLGTEEIRGAFLAGLADADAGPSRNVLLNSNKIEFLRQVQKLALSLGISTTLHEREARTLRGRDTIYEGCHWLKIRGIQSQVNAVALINPYMGRTGFCIYGQKKNGLSLPYQFIEEVMANGWRAKTVRTTKSIINPSHQGGSKRDANWDTLLSEGIVNPDWLPLKVQLVVPAGQAETFDIEVESDHEFICQGVLVSNSAGMRQGISDDHLFAGAKENLWQQDAEGNWRIDPERDALRMSNHTRVFHTKPDREESITAVRKQFYSGEGAIQWAGEAVARANCDLLNTPALKTEFLHAYAEGQGENWLKTKYPHLDAEELAHRFARIGLNPCVTADTWVHTEYGPRQVKDLIGKQHGTYINGELFSTTAEGFFYSGTKPVVKLMTAEGYTLRLTKNHRLLKVNAQTHKQQYLDWVETENLQVGDRILLHNHRDITAWSGHGTEEEGWLIGNLVGDGNLAKTAWNDTAVLRYWEKTQDAMSEYAVSLLETAVGYKPTTSEACYNKQLKHRVITSSGLAKLAAQFGIIPGDKHLKPAIEETSYQFYQGFLRGFFDADGSTQTKGVSIRLPQSNLETLQVVQRMLARLGIISTIYENRRPAGYRLLPDTDRQSAEYYCQAQHELVIAKDNLLYFQEIVGFADPVKTEKLASILANYKRGINRERFAVTIASIESDGIEPVYDCTVPGPNCFDANGLVAHNCGEIIGANFHCVSGDTLLITRDGLHKIKDIVGSPVEIWNGKQWSEVTPLQTGSDRPLYRVKFADGTHLDVTEQHRFFVKDRFGEQYQEVYTKDLMDVSKYAIHTEPFTIQYEDGINIDPEYAYTLGVAVGDGTTDQKNREKVRLYAEKMALQTAGNCSPARSYEYSPTFTDVTDLGFSGEFLKNLKTNPASLNAIASWHRSAILHFVAGLADTNGSNTDSNGIRIYISNYERAYRVQLLLTKCGIRSSLNLCAHKGAVTNYGIRSEDLYYLQITDCGEIPCQRLDVSKGRLATHKGKWQVVRSVEQLPGLHDTYCFNEPEYHKGVFGNTLAGNCNLAEVHLNQLDPNNSKEQEDAFQAAALSVAVLLNHQFVEPRYHYSRELDPIVGVSFTGLFDFFVNALGVEWLKWWEAGRPATVAGLEFKEKEAEYLNRWQEIVHQTVWDYCDRHGLKRPNRCTTVQPSGCLDRTALRIFDQGLLYADELIAPGSGEIEGLKLSVRQGILADKAIANQPLNLVKITLENGHVLRMTPNHRLAVNNNWVRADQLAIGMSIDYSLGEYDKKADAILLPLDNQSYTRDHRQELLGHSRGVLTKNITTPATLNPELGYFLGCLFGDGSFSEHKYRLRFSFNPQEIDLAERLQTIAEKLFGLTGTVSYDSHNPESKADLTFASKQLFDWFRLNQLDKCYSIDLDRIPQAIRRSSRETILAFFCGLIDTDGCVRKAGSLSIDSASEAFIRNLQQIGEAVGLCFSIFHNTQGENLQKQKNMWGLCLSRMLSQPESLAYLNTHSRKCALRPLFAPKRHFAFHPYRVKEITFETIPDYSYDFAVAGVNDDDSWYWQGALKSHNTKSLLTGASPGWHPPKSQRFIRRITFRKNDPVALACIDYGYSVIPSQSDKDENGHLLNDPYDPRCTEWLIEIPVAVNWADLPGADQIDISKFNAIAQFDFYMQVQKYYTRHNSSATIELRENEIEALGDRIYQAIRDDEGYISAALLARFDDHQAFPRLPFEPISRQEYDQMMEGVLKRRQTDHFHTALMRYDLGEMPEAGPAGCDSDKCLLPEQTPNS